MNNAHDAILPLKEKWVSLQITNTVDSVQIKVCDSGKGIPPEVLPNLFRPHFTTKPTGKGTGLGLNITQSILEAHQGSIKVEENAPNTTFVISLPKKQLAQKKAA